MVRMSATSLLHDSVRFGDYVTVRLLGRGGMGEVYLMRHVVLGVEHAVKVLCPRFGSGEAYAANAASGESFSFSGLVGAEANDTLSFETQDEEIKAFVAKLKAKKRSRRMMAAGIALAIIATLVLAALYCLF